MNCTISSFLSSCLNEAGAHPDAAEAIDSLQKELFHNFKHHGFVSGKTAQQMTNQKRCMEQLQNDTSLTVHTFLHRQALLINENWAPENCSLGQYIDQHTALYMWMYYGYYKPLFTAALTLF